MSSERLEKAKAWASQQAEAKRKTEESPIQFGEPEDSRQEDDARIWKMLTERSVDEDSEPAYPTHIESVESSERLVARARALEDDYRKKLYRSKPLSEEKLANRRLYEEMEKVRIQRRLELPAIPTRAEAEARGLKLPSFKQFAWRTRAGSIELDGVDFPEVPDERTVEAYNLLPAFIFEYEEKYRRAGFSVKPSFILKMWLQVLLPSEDAVKKNRVVWPHELRFVVEEMANPEDGSKPQMFNPSNMVAVAGRLRSENREAFSRVMTSHYTRSSEGYNFHTTVSPARDFSAQSVANPTDWCALAQYPQDFPDAVVSAEDVLLINQAVHYRYTQEMADDFTSIEARFLAETMLQAVGYQNRRNIKVSPEVIFDLAYRFPVSYIQEVRPHTGSTSAKKPIPKFVPPTD